MPSLPRSRTVHRSPAALCVVLLALTGLLSSCMTRSETVGDQFSGVVIVAANPETGPSVPKFDVPASLAGSVHVGSFPNEFSEKDREQQKPEGQEDNEQASSPVGKVGSRLTYTNLTAGQFSQLGDIISSALDSGATIDLSATRSGDIVRMRGAAALTELAPALYYVSITVEFAGPVVATNGTRAGDTSVTWTPVPGQTAEFNADVEYADPATAALPSWTWFLVIVCLAIVGVVAATAYRFRDRTPRYSDAARTSSTTKDADAVHTESVADAEVKAPEDATPAS
ncbi:hypothetical protein MUG78_16275 [Gordonia alkaliphila]|uniref:LppM family (lipo)protein n=1 Tax=Gordonia alkaliphila TaxID=1053547 RepID=UPI001FF25374|nr:hypothetical protein [Gordonia alkaliphila]MCK0440967.1 hypothetical protein [Gordonia alkaliphila]